MDECPRKNRRLCDCTADLTIPHSQKRARFATNRPRGDSRGKDRRHNCTNPHLKGHPLTPKPEAPPRVNGVRINKKFEHRFRVHETGDFPCTLCNRLFTTGTALATHVRTQHRERTFREHGFACPCCPRIFVTQSAQHLAYSK